MTRHEKVGAYEMSDRDRELSHCERISIVLLPAVSRHNKLTLDPSTASCLTARAQ
jgi:hypothetical protein